MADDNTARAPLRVAPNTRPAAEAVRFFSIRDFERLQHYKDRALVWVKLYVEMLDDYEFAALPDSAKYHAVGLMLLAARSGNKLPNDPAWVAARIGASEPVNLALLYDSGFLDAWQPRVQEARPGEQLLPLSDDAAPAPVSPTEPVSAESASNLLATCYQVASTEQNRTEQTRADTDTDTAPASAARLCPCCGVSVCSQFSLSEAAELVKRWKREGRLVGGRSIENIYGLARTIHREGTADEEIKLLLRPPPRREFLDEPCLSCFGSKFKAEPGKGGVRDCPDCLDERGVRTGKRAKSAGAPEGVPSRGG
ncbi:MAG TPA: hypothetical protein VHU19_14400 [Pyrinomonadaceae bacterium]|nr:hypothetical protein [Pyrinomonadaceae bacterium]